MAQLEYNHQTFTIFLAISAPLQFLGLVLVIYNIFRHRKANYQYERKRWKYMIFILLIVSELVLFGGLWAYRYAEIAVIIVWYFMGTILYGYYSYVRETVKVRLHQSLSQRDSQKLHDKTSSLEFHSAHVQLLAKKRKYVWYEVVFKDLEHAHSHQKLTTYNLVTFILTSLLTQTIHTTLNESIKSLMGLNLIRIYSLVYTMVIGVFKLSYTKSLDSILPHEKFTGKVSPFLIALKISHLWSSVLSVIRPNFDPYSWENSARLLFIAIFSGILLIFITALTILFDPQELEETAEHIDFQIQLPDDHKKMFNLSEEPTEENMDDSQADLKYGTFENHAKDGFPSEILQK